MPEIEFIAHTELGAFKPRSRVADIVPYATRVAYRSSRRVRLTRSPLRWAHSALRSAGEFFVGAFAPILDAV